ncbi:MAG: bifunctional glycosyltransferase/class I SAM-dependent methyltransferase [Methylococcales bacterium]|nr:bifunctional glycosyltransferase/class I SAM-dependent methyltransferase [Methylococcales bacterium]
MNTTHRIGINMIVKNETPVLERLFKSVKDLISYYVIVDTGSTDGTPEFIKTWMDQAGIPGEVHHEAWVNFGHNRNQALEHAYKSGQVDWLLLIDADEELAYTDPMFYQQLQPGISYSLEKHHGELRYGLMNLINITDTCWRWQGVVHEYLERVSGSNQQVQLSDAWIIYHIGEGVRSRGITAQQKYLADARLLVAELKKNPQDVRSQFYLAQSYNDAGDFKLAYKHYLLRAGMQGWQEENFVAQYRAGKLAVSLNKSYAEIAECFLKAFEMRPTRGAEPLYQLAVYCRNKQWYAQGYLFAKAGAEISYPTDKLFVEKDIYQWQIFDELSIAAYWNDHYAESKTVCEKLLTLPLTASDAERIRQNRQFAVNKLEEVSSTVKNCVLPLAQPSTVVLNKVSENERIKYTACPLCESIDITVIKTANCSGHTLYQPLLSPNIIWKKCSTCTHVFTEGYYTQEACELIFSKTHENQKLAYEIEQQRIISSRMIEKVLPYENTGVWLDIGFGNGSLLFTAQEYGFKPIGVDLRIENVNKLISLGIEAHCKNLNELKLSDQCSVISMADVLEHIPYPKQALASVYDLLETGGVLFISMPNSENQLWELMDRENSNPYWGEIEHYHNFSRTRLYKLLQDFGFTPIRYGISERYRVCMEIVAIKL